MGKYRIPTVIGVLVAIAAPLAAPAKAAEALETKLQICSSCHGANGQPISANIPIIWGQTEYFLTKQLHDYKTGDRSNEIMQAMAQTLTQPELRPAARYFSSKTWPAKQATATQTSATAAAAAPAAPPNTAVCRICHQDQFQGGLPAPRLAGQSYEYLVEAMRSFADGTRTNNMDMVKLMQERSPEEREAIARYLSNL